jgi:glutaredoxin 2
MNALGGRPRLVRHLRPCFPRFATHAGRKHYVDQEGDRVGGFEVKLHGSEGVLFDIAGRFLDRH